MENRLLKNGWLNHYLDYTKEQESPILFHTWVGISVIAGTLRRNCYVDRQYGILYPNLYVILVSPTGKCRKSRCARIGVERFLNELDGFEIIREKTTPEALISAMSNHAVKNGSKFIPDSTCYIFAPELSILFGKQTYVDGLVDILTGVYEGPNKWEYRRNKGNLTLENSLINFLGASNPEWLAKGLNEDSFGGGFMGRTVCVFEDERKKIAFPTLPEDLRIMLVDDLRKIADLKGEFKPEKEMVECFKSWYESFEPDFSGRMAGYLERKQDLAWKVSMVLSVSERSDLIITQSHFTRALELLDIVEKKMSKAFIYIGNTREASVSQHIVEYLNTREGIAERKSVIAKVRHLIRSIREFDAVIETLEQSGLLYKVVRGRTIVYALTEAYDGLISKLNNEESEQNDINTKIVE